MHHFHLRVYYEDTDAGGVVYYANYLKFFERARTEWLRDFGIEQGVLAEEHERLFVVRRCILDCIKPARLDDRLTIETEVDDIKRVSITLRQRCLRGTEVLSTLAGKLGVVDKSLRPSPLPDAIMKTITTTSRE